MSSPAEFRVLRPVPAPRLAPRPAAPKQQVPRPLPRSRTPIELTVEVLRGPYRPLVVWALLWGPRPLAELMRPVPDGRERIGRVLREVRPDSNRRASYSLSPFGETLRPVVGAMYEWGLLCAGPCRSSQDRTHTGTGA